MKSKLVKLIFNIRYRSIFIFALFGVLSSFDYNQVQRASGAGLTGFSLSFGTSSLRFRNSMDNFWYEGYSFAGGAQIPFSIWRGYQQNWLEIEYDNFDAKNTGVDRFNPFIPSNASWGKNVNILTIAIKTKFMLKKETKKWVPFVSLGFGYFKRSMTYIRINSLDMPIIKNNYKATGAYMIGVGSNFKISKRFILFVDWTNIRGFTRPGKTEFWPFRFGLIYR